MKESIEKITARLRTKQETRIAIQKDGRLSAIAWSLLETCIRAAGIEMPEEVDPKKRGKKLILSPEKIPNLKILLVRQSDIPWYVSSGNADFGIAGEDQVIEQGAENLIAERLGEGKCSLVIAASSESAITKPEDLNGKIIATSFPRMLSEYCEKNNIKPKGIIVLDGSVEAAAALGIADAIADLLESGETLKANGLQPIITIRSFEAVLLAKNDAAPKREEISVSPISAADLRSNVLAY